MTDPSRQRAGLILQQLDELPTLPAVATRVLQVTSDHDSSADDVVKLISSDPALSARILRLVARAGSATRAETIERAVVLLGFEAVRAAVLAVSVVETFGGASAGKFDRPGFWTHCLAVACAAELLAPACQPPIDPAAAFLAGLLHDLGKIALDAALPKSFARVIEATDLLRGDIAAVERNVIGLDHMTAGKRVAETWQLPTAVRDCIWLHGQGPELLPATVTDQRLVNLITLADQLAREQHIGYSGNHLFSVPRSALLQALGLPVEATSRAATNLVSAVSPRVAALGLGQADSSDLYRDALQQANRELGRISEQLTAKNKKLGVRAKFFEALAAFQHELRPDAPPADVMAAIGTTAAGALETGRVLVYSLPPARGFADVTLVERDGTILAQTLIDADTTRTECDEQNASEVAGFPRGAKTALSEIVTPTGASSAPLAGSQGISTVPVRPVGDDLEWLLAEFSPRLPGTRRHWICLGADGLSIGGVVWGGPAGEADRLAAQASELSALAAGWSLALRTTQIRDEAKALAEQLAEANHRLQAAHDQIVRTRMLTTVAEVAAGCAHEMNNPLAVISGRSQLLSHTLSNEKDRANANLIFEKAQQASALITELMHFAKPETAQPEATDMARLIDRAVATARERFLQKRVDALAQGATLTPAKPAPGGGGLPESLPEIQARSSDLPAARIDARQVTDALVEILLNALQAAPSPVRVTIDHDALGGNVVVTVADDGPGMDEHTLRHAADPFFSARTAGRRRGMGLAKAQRWIESSGGTLRLESRPGHGTRVIVLLPVSTAAAVAVSVAVTSPRVAQG